MSKAIHVVDIGYGDSGKGTVTDALVRRLGSSTVVLPCGGSQRSHNVHTPEGLHHAFAQIGSGSFVPGVETIIGKDFLFSPVALVNEAEVFDRLHPLGWSPASDNHHILDRVFVDARAKVITPIHRALNQMRERARGADRHGSCGMGIGECVNQHIKAPWATIYAANLNDVELLKNKLLMQMSFAAAEAVSIPTSDRSLGEVLSLDYAATKAFEFFSVGRRINVLFPPEINAKLKAANYPIFEGAQGVMLDETFGFNPHTTWATVTQKHGVEMLAECGWTDEQKVVAVSRTYATRHGYGPFPTESPDANHLVADDDNTTGEWQGSFRAGWFDELAIHYALNCIGQADYYALTHTDKCEGRMKIRRSRYSHRHVNSAKLLGADAHIFDVPGWECLDMIRSAFDCAGVKPLLVSRGKTHAEKDFHLWTAKL